MIVPHAASRSRARHLPLHHQGAECQLLDSHLERFAAEAELRTLLSDVEDALARQALLGWPVLLHNKHASVAELAASADRGRSEAGLNTRTCTPDAKHDGAGVSD